MNIKNLLPYYTITVSLLLLISSIFLYTVLYIRPDVEYNEKQVFISALGRSPNQRLWCFDTLEAAQEVQFILDDAYRTANCSNYYFDGPFFLTNSEIIHDLTDLRGEFGLYYNVSEVGTR
jgi:hypothetical protein